MTDHLSKKERSRNMAAIKGHNTLPEVAVRKLALSLGYRASRNSDDLPGRPDLVFLSKKLAIAVNGCFWHQHNASACKARPPKTNRIYWVPKLKRNVQRDARNRRLLRVLGWRTMVVWECQIKDKDRLAKRLSRFLKKESV